MSATSTRWYRSKVDWWLAVILAIPPVAAVAVMAAGLVGGELPVVGIGATMTAIMAAVYFGVTFPIRYGFDELHLIVRHGLCRQMIPLAKISNVRPTHNPLSSPALSLDRLWVQYGTGLFRAIMISPAERDAFLNDLSQRAGLKREGDRLVRE